MVCSVYLLYNGLENLTYTDDDFSSRPKSISLIDNNDTDNNIYKYCSAKGGSLILDLPKTMILNDNRVCNTDSHSITSRIDDDLSYKTKVIEENKRGDRVKFIE